MKTVEGVENECWLREEATFGPGKKKVLKKVP